MVTASEPDLLSVLATIAAQGTTATMGDGDDDEVYECPSCGLDGLTHHQLWVHHPLYHVNEPNVPTVCPLCPSPKKGKKPKYPSLLWLSFVQNRRLIYHVVDNTHTHTTRTLEFMTVSRCTCLTRMLRQAPTLRTFPTPVPPPLLTRIACIACANSLTLRSNLRLCVGRVPTVRRPVPACARVLQRWVLAARRACRSRYCAEYVILV
jgi:hypothetical protein